MKTIKPGKAKEPQVKIRPSTRSRGQPNLHQSKAVASAKNLSVRNSSVTSDNDICPRCFEATDSQCLTCDICRDSIHGICTGLQSEVYDIFLKIASDVGWVCADCRASCRSKLHTLQSSVARTNEELSTLRTLIAELKSELDS